MDVSDLAKVIGYEVDSLLEAINQAGLSQSSANDNISTEDRKKFLNILRAPRKVPRKLFLLLRKLRPRLRMMKDKSL